MSFGVAFESVLDAARAGAPWAWNAIYREIAGPVTGFFRSRGLADPESAAGDVFFEVSRDLETFVGTEETFRTMVFTIAYKRLKIEERHPKPAGRTALSDRVLDQIQSEIEVVVDDSMTVITPTLRTAFEVLEPEQRDVLSLRVVAGLSVEQTADVMGASVEAIETGQRRALARMRGTISSSPVTS